MRAFCATVKTIGFEPLSKLIKSEPDNADIDPTLLEKFMGLLRRLADEEVHDLTHILFGPITVLNNTLSKLSTFPIFYGLKNLVHREDRFDAAGGMR